MSLLKRFRALFIAVVGTRFYFFKKPSTFDSRTPFWVKEYGDLVGVPSKSLET